MCKRRGTTLVEMALVVTLTAIVVSSIASLYGFTMSRLAHSTTNYASVSDATAAADTVEATVRAATSCREVYYDTRKALVCTMPSSGTDRDNDGFLDTYTLTGVTRRGIGKFGSGRRIWYYMADATGVLGSTGTTLWRAQRNDDLFPGASDTDRSFTYATSTRVRMPLLTSFDFSINASARSVSFTLIASSLLRDERAGTEPSEQGQSYTYTESRTAYWRNRAK